MKVTIYILDRFFEKQKLYATDTTNIEYFNGITDSNIDFTKSTENNEGSIYIVYGNLPASCKSSFTNVGMYEDVLPLSESSNYVIKENYIDRQYDVSFDSNRNLYYIDLVLPDASGKDKFRRIYIRQSNRLAKDLSGIQSSYEFDVNPSDINPSYRKLNTETRTSSGWNIQRWGNDLPVVSFSGSSKGLLVKDKSLRTMNIVDSQVWKNLITLKKLYLEASRDLSLSNTFGILYFDSFFIGYFTDFQGPELDADSPFRVRYSFKFKVTREIHKENYSEKL